MEVTVLGARGMLDSVPETMEKVRDFEARHGVKVQLFRADRVFGALHLRSAVELATRAFDQGRRLADDLGMEIMLYSAAERQIGRAIEKMGVPDGTGEVALAMVGRAPITELLDLLGLSRDDAVLEPGGKDFTIFGITTDELALAGAGRVTELVVETVALSELSR